MQFDNEQLPPIVIRARVLRYESTQCRHQGRNRLRMIAQLNGHDPSIGRWPVRRNVGEIAVQGYKDAVELLCLCDDLSVGCSNGQVITQQQDVASNLPQAIGNRTRHALVAKET
jgi:hypothetical protein